MLFPGERRVRQLLDSLLHRHRGRDEGDLHLAPHVEALREELPAGHGRRVERDARPEARRRRAGALRDAHTHGHHHGLLQQPLLRPEHHCPG